MKDLLNTLNVLSVYGQIEKKKACTPFHATVDNASSVVTDYDTFPYPRYFRGIPGSNLPIVAEREAGWRPRYDSCYKASKTSCGMQPVPYPDHCFETACSTVFPCYPGAISRHTDREAMLVAINNACIPQYR